MARRAIKPADLFGAVVAWDVMRKKEASGAADRELQERIERKTAELMATIDMEAMKRDVAAAVDKFMAAIEQERQTLMEG